VAGLPWLPELPSRAEWHQLYHRFAPFELATGEHTLVFRGTGSAIVSAAWQTAVANWAALRWSELRAGRSGAAHGRALVYRRAVPTSPDRCDILEVTEYGTAYTGVAPCEGGGGERGRYAWLDDALWEMFSAWLAEWRAYEDTTGLSFFARGDRAPGTADVARLTDWVRRAIAYIRSDTAVALQP
jgi:hypothetical protein